MKRKACGIVEIESYVRGHHVYQDDWTPFHREVLQLKREPDNSVDKNAVAVVKNDGSVVGHVPYNLAPTFSNFLKRDFNKATVEITGNKVNRGAGYGLELPCKYCLSLWPQTIHG